MAKVRLSFNRKGFRDLLRDPGVRQNLRERAQRVADAAGPGVEILPEQEPHTRAHLVVGPVTPEAARRVAKDNTLLRALEAGRGE